MAAGSSGSTARHTGREEADYSHRSLFEKLGITAGARVAILGSQDAAFLRALDAALARKASPQLRGRYDFVFLKLDQPRDLDLIGRAARHLSDTGALWVFHPKGRGAAPTDAEVRGAGLAAGLVDNKISAYTQSHTGTRYVLPVAKRKRRSS